MRGAAVYVVALFSPLAFAASIWPRWLGALRRTGELLVVVIGRKRSVPVGPLQPTAEARPAHSGFPVSV
jgi:hypothetical protein